MYLKLEGAFKIVCKTLLYNERNNILQNIRFYIVKHNSTPVFKS